MNTGESLPFILRILRASDVDVVHGGGLVMNERRAAKKEIRKEWNPKDKEGEIKS